MLFGQIMPFGKKLSHFVLFNFNNFFIASKCDLMYRLRDDQIVQIDLFNFFFHFFAFFSHRVLIFIHLEALIVHLLSFMESFAHKKWRKRKKKMHKKPLPCTYCYAVNTSFLCTPSRGSTKNATVRIINLHKKCWKSTKLNQ